MATDLETVLRDNLLTVLQGGNAHMSFDDAVKNFPMDHINTLFQNGEYTAWDLLEHIRITQNDIIEYIKSPPYTEKEWPKEYWPTPQQKATEADWKKTIQAYKADVEELTHLVTKDLTAIVATSDGPTLLKEILLVCDHTSYHIGEFAIMRQVMNTWDKRKK